MGRGWGEVTPRGSKLASIHGCGRSGFTAHSTLPWSETRYEEQPLSATGAPENVPSIVSVAIASPSFPHRSWLQQFYLPWVIRR